MGIEVAIWTGLALLIGLIVGAIIAHWLIKSFLTEQIQQQLGEQLKHQLDPLQRRLDELQDKTVEANASLRRLDNLEPNNLREQVSKLPLIKKDVEGIAKGVQDLITILLGRRSGQAGERLVKELLGPLIGDWVVEDIQLGTGRVEFAIQMAGGYYVPLDSKLVAADLVAQLDDENVSDQKRKQIEQRIAEQTRKYAREIARKYLIDKKTLGFGVAAVPDSVYALCRSVVAKELVEQKIVVVPYSLLVPFVLSLYLIAQRLGISAQLSETQQLIGQAQTLLQQTLKDLRNREKDFTAVQNAYRNTLNNVEQAERNLRSILQGDIPLPPHERQESLELEDPT